MGDKLLPNFGAKFKTCESTKFRTSHCRNGVKVLKCMNEDVRALNDAFGNLNTRKNTSVHLEPFDVSPNAFSKVTITLTVSLQIS